MLAQSPATRPDDDPAKGTSGRPVERARPGRRRTGPVNRFRQWIGRLFGRSSDAKKPTPPEDVRKMTEDLGKLTDEILDKSRHRRDSN
jgi:hypothetical protein